MGDIFISYSRTDTDYAHKLAESLQSRGLHIWIDERLDDHPGRFRKRKKRLNNCDAFIVIMTPNAFASEQVQRELRYARQKLKPIFPLWLEGDEPWHSGDSTQFYDVRRDKLPETQFYSALKEVVAPNPPASAPTVREESVPVTEESFIEGTEVRPPPRKSRRRIVNVALRLVAIAFAIGAVIFVRTSEQGLLDSSATTSLDIEMAPTAFALLPNTTPEPIPVTRNYQISLCCGYPGTQRSGLLNFSVSVETADVLQIEFDMQNDPSACSDMVLHVLWDTAEIYQTDQIGPISGRLTTGLIDLSTKISLGR